MATKEAPKVTREEIEAAIKTVSFTVLPNGRTTVCQLTLDNGFTVEGSSACVNLENYDQEKGERFAYERAFDACWRVLGFRLADRQYQAKLRKGRGARYRDAASGTYVSKEYAKLNPITTVKES